MADQEPVLSDRLLEAFGEIVGLAPDDPRFESFAELAQRYAYEASTLHTEPIDNALAPALAYRPPAPSSPATDIHFAYGSPLTETIPSAPEDLAFSSLSSLSHLIANRELSPVDLTRIYLDRLDQYGEGLRCVVTMTEELALDQARQAEQEIVSGNRRGPLHGIPWGAKDLLATQGIRTTWGATPFKDQVPDYDAAVVERLRDAGAVLVAKLSMGALAQGAQWYGGVTQNPWDSDGDSSGSSAGSGAATASALVGFSIGTETHGSITSPSHTCGVTGLRPTFGRVSRHGAMALGYSLDKIGPMCRSAEDCAAVFSAIAGRDSRDPVTVDAGFSWPAERDPKSIRIGYVEDEYLEAEGEAAELDRVSLDVLRDLGVQVEPVKLPGCRTGLLLTIWVEAAAAFDDLARSADLDLLKEQDQSRWPDIFRAARTVSATDYLRAQRLRAELVHEFQELMTSYDAIAAPAQGGRTSLLTGNLTGNPALTFPAGFVDGRPRGMTLTGRLWDEATLLALGHLFQSSTEWHKRRPPIDG